MDRWVDVTVFGNATPDDAGQFDAVDTADCRQQCIAAPGPCITVNDTRDHVCRIDVRDARQQVVPDRRNETVPIVSVSDFDHLVIRVQRETGCACCPQDRRCPHDAARIVATENGVEIPLVVADVLETTEHPGGNGEDVAGANDDTVFDGHTDVHAPLTRKTHEHLGGVVQVRIVHDTGVHARRPDAVAVRFDEIDERVLVLRHARSDEAVARLALRPRKTNVDERRVVGDADERRRAGPLPPAGGQSPSRAVVRGLVRMDDGRKG